MKAPATWSQHSHSLIVVALVAVVEVGGGVEVARVRAVRAARRQRCPGVVVGARVMMIRVRHCQQNCRSLQRHFNQLSFSYAEIQLSTLFNCRAANFHLNSFKSDALGGA